MRNGNDTYRYEYFLKDHLGNTRVTIDDQGGNVARVVQSDEYYAFGLNRSRYVSGDKNNYLYNGKEKQDVLTEQYDYGARFYDPVVGRFNVIDRFAEKYMGNSPYQYAADNPILNIDINGDSVIVAASITSNKVLNKAFNDFANTKAGRKFLSNYAAQGQTIGGYTFKTSGKYNDKGIDVNYAAKNLGDSDSRGETGRSIGKDGRADIDVTLNTQFSSDAATESFNKSMTIAHESFIHVDLFTKDFLDNSKFDYSNIDPGIRNIRGLDKTHYHHRQVLDNYINKGYYPGSSWPLGGYNVMQEINQKNNVGRTPAQIMQRLWDYSGGVKIDLNGKAQ